MMKTKIVILFALAGLLVNTTNAQEYKQKPQIDPFVGTWEWTSGNESFKIIISKQKVLTTIRRDTYYEDILVGWHSYTKNGVVVSSSMDKANTQYATWSDAGKTSGLRGGWGDYKHIGFFFYDKKHNKTAEVTLTLSAGNTDEATWKIERTNDYTIVVREGDPEPKSEPVLDGWSVPTQVVMKKEVLPAWNWGSGGFIPYF